MHEHMPSYCLQRLHTTSTSGGEIVGSVSRPPPQEKDAPSDTSWRVAPAESGRDHKRRESGAYCKYAEQTVIIEFSSYGNRSSPPEGYGGRVRGTLQAKNPGGLSTCSPDKLRSTVRHFLPHCVRVKRHDLFGAMPLACRLTQRTRTVQHSVRR
eukprot:361217-Chlamydomonas_euryale.AAC.2